MLLRRLATHQQVVLAVSSRQYTTAALSKYSALTSASSSAQQCRCRNSSSVAVASPHLHSIRRHASSSSVPNKPPSSSTTPATTSYTSTMLLPSTEFPQHVKSIHLREESLQSLCRDQVYEWQKRVRATKQDNNNTTDSHPHPSFLLHDGPPFANGSLHTGHFLNKVLKDIINRYKILRGYHVEFVPGWDCHGLPIEQKALEKLKGTNSAPSAATTLSPIEIRSLARDFAQTALEEQRRSFLSWGILGDWSRPYITMSPHYEASQLDVFATMVERGLIERGKKPVFWSPVSKTALAEAELEYVDDHVSTSVYVKFPITSIPATAGLSLETFPNLSALIWTTTPWTLPGNVAVAYNKDLEYCVVRVGVKLASAAAAAPSSPSSSKQQPPKDASEEGPSVEGSYLLLAKESISDVLTTVLKRDCEILLTLPGESLSGVVSSHPFLPSRTSPFIHGSHVLLGSGTSLVHTAPAHGMEDFQVCREHGIMDIPSVVDEKGDYTNEVGVEGLIGQNVLKGANKHVLQILRSNGSLIYTHKLVHRFPYDWRSKTPVIQRATEQWFCKLDSGIQENAIASLKDVEMIPSSGRQRLTSMIETRKEWCISRQRSWGVPIPVFYDTITGEALLTKESIMYVRKIVAEHPKGTEAWWLLPVEELLAPEYRTNGRTYTKGMDTMDVWFDSGCSWKAVVEDQIQDGTTSKNTLRTADLYLEGSDQHRGWFQSSLLTRVATTPHNTPPTAPYKTILTHGMVLDEQMRKMSKSIGNVIDPQVLIRGSANVSVNAALEEEAKANDSSSTTSKKKRKSPHTAKPTDPLGIDHLRLWVSSTDYTTDVSIGPTVLASIGDVLKKLRGTLKFLLGSIGEDFDIEKDYVQYSDLPQREQYMLGLLREYEETVTRAYDSYSFQTVFTSLQQFNSVHLSAFYLDVIKDTLYADSVSSKQRKAVQTVLLEILVTITKSFAPILPHLAEDVWKYVPQHIKAVWAGHSLKSDVNDSSKPDSIFLQGWFSPAHSTRSIIQKQRALLHARFTTARRVKGHVTKLLEGIRQGEKTNTTSTGASPPTTTTTTTTTSSSSSSPKLTNFNTAQIDISLDGTSRLYAELEEVGEKDLASVWSVAHVRLRPVRSDTAAATSLASSSTTTSSTSLTAFDTDLSGDSTSIYIQYRPGAGLKCPRCWLLSTEITDQQPCCTRCTQVLRERKQ